MFRTPVMFDDDDLPVFVDVIAIRNLGHHSIVVIEYLVDDVLIRKAMIIETYMIVGLN